MWQSAGWCCKLWPCRWGRCGKDGQPSEGQGGCRGSRPGPEPAARLRGWLDRRLSDGWPCSGEGSWVHTRLEACARGIDIGGTEGRSNSSLCSCFTVTKKGERNRLRGATMTIEEEPHTIKTLLNKKNTLLALHQYLNDKMILNGANPFNCDNWKSCYSDV